MSVVSVSNGARLLRLEQLLHQGATFPIIRMVRYGTVRSCALIRAQRISIISILAQSANMVLNELTSKPMVDL